MLKQLTSCCALLLLGTSFCWAQAGPPDNWFNLDPKKDGVSGVGTETVYQELLAGKTGETVIVAIIDSGVDPEHEDLADVMWINEDEIAGNGIDDDNNGYVDDIHGWNFIGGPNGNVHHDQLEITRLVAHYQKIFEGRDTTSFSKKEKVTYAKYKDMLATVTAKRESMANQLARYQGIVDAIDGLVQEFGGKPVTKEMINNHDFGDNPFAPMIQGMAGRMDDESTLQDIRKDLEGALNYFSSQADYYYNIDFDGRSIVGDNYGNSYEKGYGNSDVKGPDASHGTHVAGIVAAIRGNDVGMDGVADNVRIMSVRAVPDGDERDKDVANAIIYAVDNGASIINMSFGKGYSWDKKAVDKAVKYAAKKDVLLVHAAGNSGENTDVAANFPIDSYDRSGLFKFLQKKSPDNWLEIGALSWKSGEDAVATFSNYGSSNVDIFSPGVDIYSTTPDQGYDSFSGTSMASPVTAGVAAIIRSYFPELKASEVKDIILQSGSPQGTTMVKVPGGDELVPFNSLSVTGATLNAVGAVKLAQRKTGKTGGKPAPGA